MSFREPTRYENFHRNFIPEEKKKNGNPRRTILCPYSNQLSITQVSVTALERVWVEF
jgi:hypothetical protein